jgi:hypothetical protein
MTISTIEQVDNYVQFAEEEYTAGKLRAPVFYKVLVTLASEYLKDFADLDKALVLLNRIPVEYYDHDLHEQLLEDSLFAGIVLEFIYHLNRMGIIDSMPVRPTQHAAEA